LHKAAGTLACELLRQSSLRLNKVKSLNCNCQVESEDLLNRRNPRKGGILRLVQTGNGVELRAELRRRRWVRAPGALWRHQHPEAARI
jgi:hypothetical protein